MTLAQNDRRWGSIKLGDGDATIGGAGCVLVALVEAARFLETRPAGLLPPHANEQARQAHAFYESQLIVHQAAPLFGLTAPLAERVQAGTGVTAKDLATALEGVLADGGVAMLRVAHDKGEHTVLCTRLVNTDMNGGVEAECTDSAPGTVIRLAFPELVGTVMWKKGDVRRYRVLGVRPIRRAAQ
jgi:hypothetical protein